MIRIETGMRCTAGLLITCALVAICITPARSSDYAKMSVAELIDALTQLDEQSPGVNSAAIYEGFIGNETPGSFQMGVLGVAPPKVPPQMRELVRRGPLALQELMKHLDHKRPTKLEAGNKFAGKQVGVNAFMLSISATNMTRVRHIGLTKRS